ncbi:hypothetical protein FJT64_011294 [Amphibalanus amphitrite]|uniref:Ras-associating domain-containing protein n=1 Tax=Amphibalanus amphitrite TaxID=1232801 RepID=A0A6A4VJH0_AMPAM|nr:uncharacterized protein LOC122392014 [Amphibalanus amphitrite]KAF0290498.1 hypothetical protein FJT64_011294 [Amphibalanus amphitrite]
MLKHVQLSPSRPVAVGGRAGRPDTCSLSSSVSLGLVPEGTLSSRSSSYTSLNETQSSAASSSSQGAASSGSLPPQTIVSSQQHADGPSIPVKVYARCLRSDIEYKTLSVTFDTTCRQLVSTLLNKYRMKHRDPNLFFLTMEVGVRSAENAARTVLVLDDEAKPAQLQACRPKGDTRLILRMRQGGLVRIYDGILMQGSHYKSLLVSDRTETTDLLRLILNCNNCREPPDRFFLLEVCRTARYERRLRPTDRPVQVQCGWKDRDHYYFVLQREQAARRPRKLPWRPNLESVDSLESLAPTHNPPKTPVKSPSYHDYENYFYI